jgi:GMP synthase-like glutamine amidotransferase
MLSLAEPRCHSETRCLMQILVVENFRDTGLGQIAAAFDERGAMVDTVRAHLGEPLPAATDFYDGLVVLGGGQDALDDEGSPWFPSLLGTMRSFVDSGRATLGVCLGSQLLARAYGGQNLIGAASEFGWQHVEPTGEGGADPLLAGLPERFPIFQWHDDTFTLPRGAVRLAGNTAAHNQAFRIGRAGYGVQFHFEADRRLVREWNGAFADWLAERQPDWPARHEAEEARHGEAADAAGRAIARAWTALV